ncbi:LPS assembly protein LptD [Asticcacaulis sp. BYS171W]|uniref:LPS-assembly protein LptD n=1 Tax=Asticcacaulis aquaticus TaxID=2984212 RepID=A0ABT5HQC3_9CAUL|nr:LPS assembly protein LptD [Asticcacaulis aquaticus]MDC7681666.1 LPS assembly protein LptD [Asticcacaulis aquaticus]
MRKSSLKLSVGFLSLLAAGAIGGEASARVVDLHEDLDDTGRGIRFFSDFDDGGSVSDALPAPEPVSATPEASSDVTARVIDTPTPAPLRTPKPRAKPVAAPVPTAAPAPLIVPPLVEEDAPLTTRRSLAVVKPVADDLTPLTVEQVALPALAQAKDPVGDPAPELDVNPSRNPVVVKTEAPLEDDGLGKEGAYITADEVTSPENNIVVARGNVEMRWEGRLIRADQVWYDQTTGKTIATGNTRTINPDGSVQYADRLEIDDGQSSGTGDRIASIDTEGTKLFANKVERVDVDTNRLSEVIFTPCELCVKNNVTQEPTWHIQATSITQDRARRVVIYRNAVFKARGIPIFYLPILWHADPSAKRASGFLMPKAGYSQRRGVSLETPYLWAVSPYTDIIFSPKLSSKVNPLLNFEVNRRFYSGDFHARAGYTYESFFDNEGNKWDSKQGRGYILADGNFDINPDWRWNFTLQRVFDKAEDGTPLANLFERYKIDDGFPQAGEYHGGSRHLINQANLIRQTDTAYFNVSLVAFQSLQIGSSNTRIIDDQSSIQYLAPRDETLPVVAPLIEAFWSPKQDILGGRLTVSASGVSVIRKTTPASDIAVNATGPVDSARATLGLSWRRELFTPIGLRIAPFVEGRHDQYRIKDFDNNPATDDSHKIARSLSTAGIDFSYPLIRKFAGLTTVIEPIAQIAVSPRSESEFYLTNEDSTAFEFDDSTLFKANKSPGFDLYEGGKRLNLGLKTQFNFDNGFKLSTLVGRSFRDEPELSYYRTLAGTTYTYDPSGLAGKKSDWVVQAEFDTGKGFRGYTRHRLDSGGNIRRGETGFSVMTASSQATIRYQIDNTEAGQRATTTGPVFYDDGKRYEDLQFFGQHFFNARWGVSAQFARNIRAQAWLRSEAALIYKDDCARFELVYQRDETALLSENGKGSESISIRISLATLAPSDDDFVNIR